MDAKLTLKLDADVVAAAKQYAQRQGSSLSRVVEALLKTILEVDRDRESAKTSGPAAALYGSVPELADVDAREAVEQYLSDKFD